MTFIVHVQLTPIGNRVNSLQNSLTVINYLFLDKGSERGVHNAPSIFENCSILVIFLDENKKFATIAFFFKLFCTVIS